MAKARSITAVRGSDPKPRSVPRGADRVPGRSVGLRSAELADVTRRLKAGLPFRALAELREFSGLSDEDVLRTIRLPQRTLARRKDQGRLTQEESERLLRVAIVVERAVELFEGDVAAARAWLTRPNRGLAGASPLSATDTEIGAREVEDLIGRLEHGVLL